MTSCEWVYGTTLLSLIPHLSLGVNFHDDFGVGTILLSVVATSWLSLKPHSECFTNPYYIYIKCSCTLTSYEGVYGTTLSLIPHLSLGVNFKDDFGVGTDPSDVVTSWLSFKSHLECFTNPYYIYKVFLHFDKL